MFKSFGADLPGFTKMVVAMSEWMQEWWYVVIGIVVGTVYVFDYFKNAPGRSIIFWIEPC
jgi:Type II secretory pathway, component PulF